MFGYQYRRFYCIWIRSIIEGQINRIGFRLSCNKNIYPITVGFRIGVLQCIIIFPYSRNCNPLRNFGYSILVVSKQNCSVCLKRSCICIIVAVFCHKSICFIKLGHVSPLNSKSIIEFDTSSIVRGRNTSVGQMGIAFITFDEYSSCVIIPVCTAISICISTANFAKGTIQDNLLLIIIEIINIQTIVCFNEPYFYIISGMIL